MGNSRGETGIKPVRIFGWSARVEPAAFNAMLSHPLWPSPVPGALGSAPQDIPTLTAYLPPADKRNGATMLVLPGGGYEMLAHHEGTAYAQWFAAHGVTAYVLQYRLGSHGYRHPVMLNDAARALRTVRAWARRDGLDPARVGIIGFSAGGGVGVGAALAPKSDASPDFLVSVYGPSLQDVNVPEHAPPLFIAVGATHFNVTNGCLALFAAWKAAGKPAEIHVYDGIAAGFGMTKRGHPVDAWTERLHEWLVARELTQKVNIDL
jgi:acetyl esterase/lipase